MLVEEPLYGLDEGRIVHDQAQARGNVTGDIDEVGSVASRDESLFCP